MRIITIVASVLLSAPLVACGPDQESDAASGGRHSARSENPTRSSDPNTPYRFDEPVASFSLPDELKEISGLTVLDERHLGAVQDEEGTLYVLDFETGSIAALMSFGPPGDYEGVALANGRLFTLRADGMLVEVEGWEGGDTRTREHDTDLGRDCDAEGLGFDESGGRLLIACKEEGKDGLGDRRAVYAFDLATGSLSPEPAFVLDPAEVRGAKRLKPSAVAVHPVSGHVFLLCSVGKELVAFSPGGALAGSWDLAKAGFEQPEGLAFLPNGDAFIASEGDDDPPVLKRFAYLE